MPFVTVDHPVGLSPKDRTLLQERLAKVVMETFGAPPGNVRVFTRAFEPGEVYVASGQTSTGLPVIRVEFLPGRTLEQKRALFHDMAHVAAEVFRVPVEQIRTILYEKERQDWARGDRSMAEA